MVIYSHSRLNTFEQCPLKFKFVYIDKIEPEVKQNIEGFMGNRVHEALEKLYLDLKYQRLNELKDLILFYNSRWDQEWSNEIAVIRQEYTSEDYKKIGEKCIVDYYNHYFPFNQDKTIELEKQIQIRFYDGEEFLLTGFIDRLSCLDDGTYIIHDYKTSGSLPTQDKIEDDRQLALYSIAVRQMYKDCKRVKLIWHYLAFDKEVSTEKTEEELEELKKNIIAVIRKIESTNDFNPKMSPLCGWCPFKQLCPGFKHLYMQDGKLEVTDRVVNSGKDLVDEYSELNQLKEETEKKIEDLKNRIIKYALENELTTIYGEDNKISISSRQSLSFPKKNDLNRAEFETLIKTLGLWDELGTVDVYELAKRINNHELHPEIMKLLEKFVDKVNNTQIRLSKRYYG